MNYASKLPLGLLLGLLAAIAGVVIWSFRSQTLSGRPSVLLITIDTLRPDRLGCYGHPRNRTPAIDRLAAEGSTFERAYCDMPWTTGSMASVMTGRYSNEHGLRDPSTKINPNVETLAQILKSQNVQTGAIVGSFPLDSVYGLDRGFDSYDDTFTTPMKSDPDVPVVPVPGELPANFADQSAFVANKQHNDWYRPDQDVTTAAIQWLDEVRDGRTFFLWVHYFGPHEKLDRKRDYVAQEPEIIAAYDADVEATDVAVGRLVEHLRQLDILDDTLVVLHADHGQNLGEADYVGHTLRLDEVAVQIPFIVRWPSRVPAGLRRRDIARNIDIVPTVLDALGQQSGQWLGRSLLQPDDDPTALKVPHDAQVAYFETYLTLYFFWPQTTSRIGTVLGPMVSRGVRTPDWKMLTNEFRGKCEWGKFPLRDGAGTWGVAEATALEASRCAELGMTELYADRNGGLELVDEARPLIEAKLQREIAKHSEIGRTGEKFALTPDQESKLKALGYLQ